MKYEDIKIGFAMRLSRIVTKDDMTLFREVSSDNNSIHKEGVVFGGLIIAYISDLIGNYLPGDGAVWMSLNIDFVSPAYVGDCLVITTKIVGKFKDTNRIKIDIDITNDTKGHTTALATVVVKCKD